MDFRTLDNGGVDFHIERVKENCTNESGEGGSSVEDIGPQEEGDYSVDPVQQSKYIFVLQYYLLITLLGFHRHQKEKGAG